MVHAIVKDWQLAALNEADKSLCKYAIKVTRQQERLSPDDLDELRKHGFDDRAIHDAVQVIGYFNYITRIADALGVETETFLEPWGN